MKTRQHQRVNQMTSPFKKIQVHVKNVYGVVRVYPVCATAKLLCKLAGGQTLSPASLATIKDLGYEVEQVIKTELTTMNEGI